VNSERIKLTSMPPVKKEIHRWRTHRAALGVYICQSCPFFAADCDFQAPVPPDDMEPCGGFILLAHLYDYKLITIGDLEK